MSDALVPVCRVVDGLGDQGVDILPLLFSPTLVSTGRLLTTLRDPSTCLGPDQGTRLNVEPFTTSGTSSRDVPDRAVRPRDRVENPLSFQMHYSTMSRDKNIKPITPTTHPSV